MKNASQHLLKQGFAKASCLAMVGLLAVVLGAGAAQAQVYGYVVVNGSLLVVDSATNVVVTTVPGLVIPRAVDVSPDGSQVYVTIFNGVAVIDAATNTVLTTVATGNIPIGTVFTPDGSTAYVGNNASATVSVIDTATQTVIATVGPLGISSIGITPDGSEVWVCVGSLAGASIAVIDTTTQTISTTFPTGHGLNGAFGIDFTSDGAFAYLANSDNTVSAIDTATLATVATVPVGSLPFAIALTPDDAFAYTPNLTGASVSVVDTATHTLAATVPVGTFPRDVAITPDGTLAWVSNYNSNTVSVIDTATQTVVSTFPASPQPWGIAFMPDSDTDGVGEIFDNCPVDANPGQVDFDGDGAGDACDLDDDNDGVLDDVDNCPFMANPDQADNDGDGLGDLCDSDDDNDGIMDTVDNCPVDANADQADFDGDHIGDVCDSDADGDGVLNGADLCAFTPAGALVETATGCSIAQLCPCAGPQGSSLPWKNHGKYVSCVSQTATSFVQQGLITGAQKGAIVSAAGQSSCGK